MKVFITGATGFIGNRLTSRLIARGDAVNALVRSHQGAAELQALGANPVWGDITARESLREGMRGCDLVFHLAAWYQLGSPDTSKAEMINVEGTRNVLELAVELKIPRIVYTSTIAVYGDTHGFVPDESFVPPPGTLITEYDRTKYLAHYEVALPLIEAGAPLIIVMPGLVYGPGDPSLNGSTMRLFAKGLFPVLPGPELTLTYAHVDDIVEGHLLAAEKGEPGETYHLTGDILTMRQAAEMWARACGRRAPFLYIPGRYVKPLAPLMEALGSRIRLPDVLSADAVRILEATYLGSSGKARQSLGWSTRPPEEGFRETFDAIRMSEILASRSGALDPYRRDRRMIAAVILGAALGLLTVWILTQRRRRS